MIRKTYSNRERLFTFSAKEGINSSSLYNFTKSSTGILGQYKLNITFPVSPGTEYSTLDGLIIQAEGKIFSSTLSYVLETTFSLPPKLIIIGRYYAYSYLVAASSTPDFSDVVYFWIHSPYRENPHEVYNTPNAGTFTIKGDLKFFRFYAPNNVSQNFVKLSTDTPTRTKWDFEVYVLQRGY